MVVLLALYTNAVTPIQLKWHSILRLDNNNKCCYSEYHEFAGKNSKCTLTVLCHNFHLLVYIRVHISEFCDYVNIRKVMYIKKISTLSTQITASVQEKKYNHTRG